MTFKQLRKKHPRFTYERYEHSFTKGSFEMRFRFSIAPDIVFTPEVVIDGVDESSVKRLGSAALDNFVFHVGLAEIPSYWKCACPREIVVACGPLDAAQKAWWRSLIINGLGEFFYTNHIDFTAPEFLRITVPPAPPAAPRGSGKKSAPAVSAPSAKGAACIVPLGGGKDSLVTAELMKKSGVPFRTFVLGTTIPALRNTAAAVGTGEPIVARRAIDPLLLALNKKGYLNGHTPFSAYLAFLTVFCAALFGARSVAISQERSANEANATFKGRPINHQYSKSFAFEKKFRTYAKRYLARDIEFWSAMRPLYELQIAKLFARMPRYHSVFRSCNVGAKKNVWCGKCPKCVTVCVLLLPFLSREAVMKIFGRDVLANAKRWPEVLALLGKVKDKPFECVGTRGEMMVALTLTLKKYQDEGRPLPAILARFARGMKKDRVRALARSAKLLSSWNSHNFMPDEFAKILRAALYDHPQ